MNQPTLRDKQSALEYFQCHCGFAFVPLNGSPQYWIKARKEIKNIFEKHYKNGIMKSLSIKQLMNTPIFYNGRRVSKENMNNPIIIVKIKNKIRVIDGNHRVLTAKEKGIKSLNCYIFEIKDVRFNDLLFLE